MEFNVLLKITVRVLLKREKANNIIFSGSICMQSSTIWYNSSFVILKTGRKYIKILMVCFGWWVDG